MRKLLRKRQGGFTLIELMIVVAIIGILAAIAIPNFLRFQLRAKSSEGKTNLAAIRTAQEGYFAEFGTYVDASAQPSSLPGTAKASWPNDAGGFDTVGWSPEGDVLFQYGVADDGDPSREFMAVAIANIDGNGTNQEWAYVKPVPGSTQVTNTTIGGSLTHSCPADGVFNPADSNNNLLTTVGPCDNQSGQSEF